ncbi:hypothetical protein J5N97_025037 [Dioscorea zingiberensis]|uniref:Uncharacterized protein n=1 Tax=Dioscorea zingiberensis TaxID=325984 RepID=A0A9D5C841_9LILI|nr:hypothetical protein J5N97_025037 [Dioscorea zingiberensis]
MRSYLRWRTRRYHHTFKAFLYLEQQFSGTVSILPYINISPYTTMHDYICLLIMDKKAKLIILPFHRRVPIDGAVEAVDSTMQAVNMYVLCYVPRSGGDPLQLSGGGCSKGGLVADRIAVFFLSEVDDRDALAYAVRMAINPLVKVVGEVQVVERVGKEEEGG